MFLKHRAFVALIGLLYLSVAVVLGVMHDHHAVVHADECSACEWQLHAATDVPVVAVVSFSVPVVAQPVRVPAAVLPVAPFCSSTASRAPPVTLA